MVRAGPDARNIAEFRDHGVVAVGWQRDRPLRELSSRTEIERELERINPELTKGQRLNAASQLDRFRIGIEVGDRVITYDPDRREYLVGTVLGEPEFDPSLVKELPNFRRVRWTGTVSRDKLSVASRNSLGAIQTLFRLPDECAAELDSVLAGHELQPSTVEPAEEPDDPEAEILADLDARAREFIKDRLNALAWDDMERLVAGLLRAMGYKTRLTPGGADRGADIVASPDGFGFEQPRIVVEVKHRNQQIGSQQIRSFLGGRHKDDKGLYVSSGGFSRDARYEADRAGIPLTLMDLDDLVAAVVEYYEQMDGDTKALIRLRRLYWPA
ncbi:MAG: restriction endonuclease [Chromatiales bacterium]|nr:restriction endonuclease [Chromatiales bacterium]